MAWSPASFLMNCDYQRGYDDGRAGKEPDEGAVWHTYMDGYRTGKRDREEFDRTSK